MKAETEIETGLRQDGKDEGKQASAYGSVGVVLRKPLSMHDQRDLLVVCILVLIGILMNANVISNDKAPAIYDERDYYCISLLYADYIVKHEYPLFQEDFWRIEDYRPPLMMLTSQICYAIWGNSLHVARNSVGIFIPVMLFSIYGTTRLIWGSRAGLLAAYFGLTLPVLFGFSRTYMPEYPMSALLMLSIYILVRMYRTEGFFWLPLLGAVWGLGLLTKWTFLVWASPPTLFVLWHFLRQNKGCRFRFLRYASISLICMLALAGPWYLPHIDHISHKLLEISFDPPRADLGPGSLKITDKIGIYASFVQQQIGTPTAILVLPLLSLFLLGPRREHTGSAVIHFFWVPAMVLFLFVINKNVSPRFILPAYLAAIPMVAAAFELVEAKFARRLLTGLAVMALALNAAYLNLTEAEEYRPGERWNMTGIQQYSDIELPHGDILGVLADHKEDSDTSIVLNIHNVPEFHCPLAYMFMLRGLPFEEKTPAEWDRLRIDEFDYEAAVDEADFVITKSGLQGDGIEVTDRLKAVFQSRMVQFDGIARIPLSEESEELYIYKRKETARDN